MSFAANRKFHFHAHFSPKVPWNFSLIYYETVASRFHLVLNWIWKARGDIWVWSETIFLHCISCFVIWELCFLPLSTLCISLLPSLIFADHILNWRSLQWDLDSSHGWQPACGLLSRSATKRDDFCWEFYFPTIPLSPLEVKASVWMVTQEITDTYFQYLLPHCTNCHPIIIAPYLSKMVPIFALLPHPIAISPKLSQISPPAY